MKRLSLILLFCSAINVSFADNFSAMAISVVTSFYANMSKLVQKPDGDEAIVYIGDMMNMCCDNEIQFPNDIKFLKNYDDHPFVYAVQYAQQLQDIAKENNVNISIADVSAEYCIGPVMTKSDADNRFIRVSLLKTVSMRKNFGDDVTRKFSDQVLVDTRSNKIVQITDEISQYTMDDIDKITAASKLFVMGMDFYDKHKYEESYKSFYRYVQVSDYVDPEAYFRLAILAYKRNGCSDKPRKVTDIECEQWLAAAFIKKNSDMNDKLLRVIRTILSVNYFWGYDKDGNVIKYFDTKPPMYCYFKNGVPYSSNGWMKFDCSKGNIKGIRYIHSSGKEIDRTFKAGDMFEDGKVKVQDFHGDIYYIDESGNRIE
jgi:hypothetical protein